ncbi:MAG: hypothetical protein HN348_32275 [Proteobacteria bacterium]|jgi:hypothetical protein|nr:hypothetical protein [Pseudomonadota bacterium]
MIFLFLQFACMPEVVCPEGQLLTSKGICVTPQYKTFDTKYTADLPECELAEPSSRLDLRPGCVDGACPDMSYYEINEVLFEDGVCTNSFSLGTTSCKWGDGIRTNFTDDNNDGLPDSNSTASGLYVESPYSGSDKDGLAIGISIACFMEVLGYTDRIETLETDDGLFVSELYYPDMGLFVYDRDWDIEDGPEVDGIVDAISLYGSHDW